MKNLINKQIQSMKPYRPPIENRRAYRGLLLDFNEKTMPPTPKVVRALKKFLSQPNLQLYPEYGDIEKRVAKYAGVKKDMAMITNGSDQAIDLVFRAFTKSGDKVIIPQPSFAMFYQCARIEENKIIKIDYQNNMSYHVEKTLAEMDKGVKLIVICNPNNPTGSIVKLENLKIILNKAGQQNTLVFIDEAYYEFSKVTAVPLINIYPNLIISRTFSKAFGLASLRIGYLLANKKYINELVKIRGPYDVNIPACIAVRAALDDLPLLNKYVDEVMNKAKPMVEKFFRNNRIEFFPSRANLILFRPSDAKKTFKILNTAGFRLRPRNDAGIENTLRLTIGTVGQTRRFIRAYRSLLSS